jgi:uncharacterized membrane protein
LWGGWGCKENNKEIVEGRFGGGWECGGAPLSFSLLAPFIFLVVVGALRKRMIYICIKILFWILFVCVLSGWADHSSNKKEMRNKRKKSSGSTCDAQTETCRKKEKREKKFGGIVRRT